MLFLFICFSPAWEAAPSPPPQYQALLRQVASTIIDSINDIPCPFLVFDHYDHFDHSSQFCWLRMLTNLGSRPQAHVSQRGWWRSSRMIVEMDHRVVTTGKRPFTTTEATAPTTTLSTSHVAGESRLFAILFLKRCQTQSLIQHCGNELLYEQNPDWIKYFNSVWLQESSSLEGTSPPRRYVLCLSLYLVSYLSFCTFIATSSMDCVFSGPKC